MDDLREDLDEAVSRGISINGALGTWHKDISAGYLRELGYRKVTLCGKCKDWGGNHEHSHTCPVCAGWLKEGLGLCYGHFIENIDGVLTKAEDFCPYGEPEEGAE